MSVNAYMNKIKEDSVNVCSKNKIEKESVSFMSMNNIKENSNIKDVRMKTKEERGKVTSNNSVVDICSNMNKINDTFVSVIFKLNEKNKKIK